MGVETLSDHRYIKLSYTAALHGDRGKEDRRDQQRWSLSKLDEGLLMESLYAQTWLGVMGQGDVNEVWERIRGIVWCACDTAMPRSRPCPRRSAYWWSEEIAEIRRKAIAARRRLYRARRRRRCDAEEVEEAEYRLARCSLKDSIKRAKAKAWEEFMASLDEDPWGRPYKLVLRKLRARAPPTTETVSPQFLGEIVGKLFPTREVDPDPFPLFGDDMDREEECGVTGGGNCGMPFVRWHPAKPPAPMR